MLTCSVSSRYTNPGIIVSASAENDIFSLKLFIWATLLAYVGCECFLVVKETSADTRMCMCCFLSHVMISHLHGGQKSRPSSLFYIWRDGR